MARPAPHHVRIPGHPGVTIIDDGDRAPTLVSTLGAFSQLDPFETDRYQRLAAAQHRRIAVVEPVGLVPMKPAELVARNTWEGLFARRHLWENHHLTEIPTPSAANLGDGRRLPDPLHLLWALCRGLLADAVCDAARAYPGLAVTLIRGGSSRLVDPQALRTLAKRLHELGATVDTRVVVGAHHALWHSRPTLGRLAEAIG